MPHISHPHMFDHPKNIWCLKFINLPIMHTSPLSQTANTLSIRNSLWSILRAKTTTDCQIETWTVTWPQSHIIGMTTHFHTPYFFFFVFSSASPMTCIHSDPSSAFLVHALIHIILRPAWTSNHLSSGLPIFPLPSSFASNTIVRTLLFPVLIKWPTHTPVF
jgi:hypothetical protein